MDLRRIVHSLLAVSSIGSALATGLQLLRPEWAILASAGALFANLGVIVRKTAPPEYLEEATPLERPRPPR